MFGLSRKIEFDILNDLFHHLLSLDRLWYQNQKTGDLMSRSTNDLRAMREFFGLGVLILIDAVFVIVMAGTMMVFINISLTLKVFIPLPLISFLFLSGKSGKGIKKYKSIYLKLPNRYRKTLQVFVFFMRLFKRSMKKRSLRK